MDTLVANNVRQTIVPPNCAQISSEIECEYYPVGLIERIRNSDIDCTGYLFLLRFNRLKEILGDKWHQKRDIVHQFIDTAFSRKYEKPNWCYQAAETDFVFALPDYESKHGARICAQIQMSVFDFFVGEGKFVESAVYEIVADSVTRIHLRRITKSELSLCESPQAIEINESRTFSQFETAGGICDIGEAEIRPNLRLERIIQLKDQRLIGHRLGFELLNKDNTPFIGEVSKLSIEERCSIDNELISIGLEAIKNLPIGNRKVLLIIPINFSTICNNSVKKRILEDVEIFCTHFGLKAIFELHGTEALPTFRLIEELSILRNHCSAILLDFPKEIKTFENMKQVRNDGYSIPNLCENRGEAEIVKSLRRIVSLIKGKPGFYIMRGLFTQRQAQLAQMVGLGHVCVRVPQSQN